MCVCGGVMYVRDWVGASGGGGFTLNDILEDTHCKLPFKLPGKLEWSCM